MQTVATILKSKADLAVHTISPDASVFDAIKAMAEYNVGALVVMDGEQLVGIITERDYARKVILLARSSRELQVRAIMSSPVMHVRPEQSNEECMVLMTDHRMRHLPVMEAGKVIGVVSIGDLVKSIISEQEFTIRQLEHYIAGDRGG
jgi:CBS domain-containing protein